MMGIVSTNMKTEKKKKKGGRECMIVKIYDQTLTNTLFPPPQPNPITIYPFFFLDHSSVATLLNMVVSLLSLAQKVSPKKMADTILKTVVVWKLPLFLSVRFQSSPAVGSPLCLWIETMQLR